ncbi:MAG TPA: IclR family transcriptional regulator [Desulfatiglandales bacterium]|nr:IclR family transcriptional regulator [Desulfatiglandales bacterium]
MAVKVISNPGRTRPSNLVQTLERASLILDILGQSPQGISIKDLSDRMDLPKGTTHRFVSSLSYFGYVRQDQNTKNYFLGFKLVELGNMLLGQLDLRKEAELFLRNLAQRTKETVHLVILDGNEIVYLDKLETEPHTGGLRMASRVGSRNPAHSCAVGKALMAYLPAEALARIVEEKGLPKRTGNTITDYNQLKEHMTLVRKQGYAVDDEENERGIRCVAAPIFNEAGKAVAAISVSGPAFRVTKKSVQEKLKKEVMETALRISQRLGFRGRTWRPGLLEETRSAEGR